MSLLEGGSVFESLGKMVVLPLLCLGLFGSLPHFDAKHIPEAIQSNTRIIIYSFEPVWPRSMVATRHGRHLNLACNGLVTIGRHIIVELDS